MLCLAWQEAEDRPTSQLKTLHEQKQISDKEFAAFSMLLAERPNNGLQSRLDSMKEWGLDIVFVREQYQASSKEYLLEELYFSSLKEVEILKDSSARKKYCFPERYYQNGKLSKRYYFYNSAACDHLGAIRSHMKNTEVLDTIEPIFTKELLGAGCNYDREYLVKERAKQKRKHRKEKKPNFIQVESFLDGDSVQISFQRPVKMKTKVVVEIHSF